MEKTILVPLDGSELSAQALPRAVGLAKKMGAGLLLLGVVAPTETWLEAAGAARAGQRMEDEADAAAAYLKFVKGKLDHEGVDVRTKVAAGRAAECIRQLAEAEGAEMIAMSTHGRSGLPRMVLGSVASEVVKTSTRPVLLVHASEEPAQEVDIKRILVPLDGSALSEAALPVAEELADRLGAELILYRVITPAAALYPGEIIPSTLPVLDDIEAAANEYVAELAEKLRDKGLKASHEVSVGYATEAILLAAAERSVGLIAMSSHGRTGIGRWLMGSVTDGVVERSPWPCLVVRPQAITDGQRDRASAGSVEVVGGIEAAKTVVPAPVISETEVEGAPEAEAPEVRPHRPERRFLR